MEGFPKVAHVTVSVKPQRNTSTRHRVKKLNNNRSAFQQILVKDLHISTHAIQLTQYQRAADKR